MSLSLLQEPFPLKHSLNSGVLGRPRACDLLEELADTSFRLSAEVTVCLAAATAQFIKHPAFLSLSMTNARLPDSKL